MRVLVTRPESEAAALAAALGERGHTALVAPLFRLDFLRPPGGFAAALAACQAVLLSSANGARALAAASELRSKPVFAVGDTTASTAEGLGFTSVVSAAGDSAALADLVVARLDPKNGPLVHVSGVEVAGDLAQAFASSGFDVARFALYEARAAETLPDSARTALQARNLDAATFFSPRASQVFARLVAAAGLTEACRNLTAIAISPAAAEPLKALPFKTIRSAARPTRQAVLDEIDQPAKAVVEEPQPNERSMSDTPSSSPDKPATAIVRRGLGVVGAFIVGVIAAILVLAGAIVSLPYWPEEARALWRGPPVALPAPVDAAAIANATAEAAKRDLASRLDDLEKRVRAAAATAAQADRPPASDPAIAELRAKIEALETRPPAAAQTEMDVEAIKGQIADLKKALADAADKTRAYATALASGEQKALTTARASAMIGIAARLGAATESGSPFATELALIAPLAKDDTKLSEVVAALQPHATSGVAARDALAAEFPAIAKKALAEDFAGDSFGERLLGKLKGLVSLRRVGPDVPGDTVEAKLARAEAALDLGDLAKAVEIVKSLPPSTSPATAPWLARAEANVAVRAAVDRLAAHAVSLLGSAGQ